MYEYYIENQLSGETTTIWGYDWKDACKRHSINPEHWRVLYGEYID